MKNSYKYVIIGSSAAGVGALNALWKLDPEGSALCISAEQESPYNTCFLVDFAAGEKSLEAIELRQMHQKADFALGKRVIAINPAANNITLSDNSEILYQQLLIATGARAMIPPIPGIKSAGVFPFHSLGDTHNILAWIGLHNVKQAVVIGAGLTGLEAADMLSLRGIEVTVIEKESQLLPHHMAKRGAQLIRDKMADAGAALKAGTLVTEVCSEQQRVARVLCSDGSEIPAQLIIVACGVQPNSELTQQSGIKLENGALVTNQYLQTNYANIYAAGDVAQVGDLVSGNKIKSCTWPDAMQQGLIAAQNMAGAEKKYPGALSITSSAFFGLKFASMGMIDQHAGAQFIEKESGSGDYSAYFLEEQVPVGFHLVGERLNQLASLRRAVITKSKL